MAFLSIIVCLFGVFSNKNAKDLISEIFNTAKVPFEIADDFEIEEVSLKDPSKQVLKKRETE